MFHYPYSLRSQLRVIWTYSQEQASIDASGTPLTDEALVAAKDADAVLLGAIGGPVSTLYLILLLWPSLCTK